jgi:hypothetical protein
LRRWLQFCNRIFIWLKSVQSVFQSIPDGAVSTLVTVLSAKTFVSGSNVNTIIENKIMAVVWAFKIINLFIQICNYQLAIIRIRRGSGIVKIRRCSQHICKPNVYASHSICVKIIKHAVWVDKGSR